MPELLASNITPEHEEKNARVWGTPATKLTVRSKWQRETTRRRLEDHCQALAYEGCTREEALKLLTDFNRAGSELPIWFEKYLPDLIAKYAPIFDQNEVEEKRVKECSPADWECPTSSDILSLQIEPRKPLVTERGMPIFYEKSVNQIFSWRGVGKSLFALGLSDLMAGGGEMLRYRCDEKRTVLYIDGELPQEQLQERIRDFVRPGSRNRVHCISPDLLGLGRSINLFEPDHAGAVRRMIQNIDAGVLILDSQGMLMSGDPLKAEFNEARNCLLQSYRQMGLCVIELHHAGKSKEQRGSSRNDDILDVQIKLAEPSGWEHGDGLKFEVLYPKMRHGARPDSGYCVTHDATGWKVVQSDAEVGVAELHREGKTQREIAKALDISPAKVNRIMKRQAKAIQ